MHALLENIFSTRKFTNSKNQIVDIHSETSKQQCEFLQRIIIENGFKSSVEVGLAYGMSTLAIIEAITKNNGRHVVMDKFQYSHWGGNGIDLVTQAGFAESITFREEFSYILLPALLAEGRTFDFAYIDSTKLFDFLLVDFFFLDKLLTVNGVIAFDDVSFPGIRKLLRYLSGLPHYEVYAQFPENRVQVTASMLTKLLRLVPKTQRLLKEEVLVTDFERGINAHCIALIKKAEDTRPYDWYLPF